MKIHFVVLDTGYYESTTEAPNYGYTPAYAGYVGIVYQSCAENEFLNAKNECEPMVRIKTTTENLCARYGWCFGK